MECGGKAGAATPLSGGRKRRGSATRRSPRFYHCTVVGFGKDSTQPERWQTRCDKWRHSFLSVMGVTDCLLSELDRIDSAKYNVRRHSIHVMITNKFGFALVICFWVLVITCYVRSQVRERREAKERAAEIKAQEQLLRNLQRPVAPAWGRRFALVGLLFCGLALVCITIGVLSGYSLVGSVQHTVFILVTVFVLIVLPLMWLCSRRPWLHNLRRPAPISDANLGKLRFSFGFETCVWRGSIDLLPGTKVPLAIVGSVDGPAPEALSMAKELAARLPSWQADIEKALFEHYEPYAEALASGELDHQGDPLPTIARSSDVWPLIAWVDASIIPVDGEFVAELNVTVPWDEEHTLGLIFKRGTFLELSV